MSMRSFLRVQGGGVSGNLDHVGGLGKLEKISDYEFDNPTNFMPGDEVIGDSFQPFLFEVWNWLPHMPSVVEYLELLLANSLFTFSSLNPIL
ncbi:hypothetical protein AVEN_33693-1 [Araneus ventricosus]|uniref:Uncharacterized protein n=1 Tax=Araneus ventricosus TaxID=182803 RepID=A0A4Y2R6X0_ARAVE|nr:hypothetical protein AVEN_33693-1 [Araneus ventricosus]